jgi:predicted glycosyltransferase
LFFAPIARRLQAHGDEVLVTARDNAQTVALARERWPEVQIIGQESPVGRGAKIQATRRRVSELRQWATRREPDVALSHNSYAQIVAARSLRIPVVTTMDFEHQPANHLAFRLADTVVLPEVMPREMARRQGATPRKVVTYPGLKEELYIGDFEPDEQILSSVGLERGRQTVVVVRTPPSRAAYHRTENPLFDDALRTIGAQADVICVVLTRHREQVAAIDALRLPNCVIPRTALDARSLMYAADMMVGAGGTMTREAALMGIPTWTLFAGTTPAVDLFLESQGKLARLERPDQLRDVGPRLREPASPAQLRARAAEIERVIVDATLALPTKQKHSHVAVAAS